MTESVHTILERWGQTVTLLTAQGEKTAKAIFQPIIQNSETEDGCVHPLGRIDQRRWLYLGQEPLKKGDQVTRQGETFVVRSSHSWRAGEQVILWQALLEREKEAV